MTTQAKASANEQNEKQNSISITWHIDDIKEQRETLTDAQARRVLAMVEHNHDASIGINWDVIDFWIDELFPEVE